MTTTLVAGPLRVDYDSGDIRCVRLADEEILRRMPDIDVDHDTKVRFHSGNVTGWSSLPVTFTPAG